MQLSNVTFAISLMKTSKINFFLQKCIVVLGSHVFIIFTGLWKLKWKYRVISEPFLGLFLRREKSFYKIYNSNVSKSNKTPRDYLKPSSWRADIFHSVCLPFLSLFSFLGLSFILNRITTFLPHLSI